MFLCTFLTTDWKLNIAETFWQMIKVLRHFLYFPVAWSSTFWVISISEMLLLIGQLKCRKTGYKFVREIFFLTIFDSIISSQFIKMFFFLLEYTTLSKIHRYSFISTKFFLICLTHFKRALTYLMLFNEMRYILGWIQKKRFLRKWSPFGSWKLPGVKIWENPKILN